MDESGTTWKPSLSSFMGMDWPVRSLWPEITSLYRHGEELKELKSSLEQLEKLQQKIFEEIQQIPPSQEIYPVACTMEKEGSGFSLTLDTKDFCPEELSVRQVGRKLHVSGKSEKKHEDGKGSYSYRTQEFRRVFDLPQGVNPEAVTCSMAGGKLYIQAPVNQPSEAAERMLPIDCQTVNTTQPERAEAQHDTSATQTTLSNPESTEYRVQPSAGQS
uniref:SHSP domain-containing protein n=2 Tax=Cyprinus carpio TaxID=7962 RepID=A0A9J7Z824_CYPCA